MSYECYNFKKLQQQTNLSALLDIQSPNHTHFTNCIFILFAKFLIKINPLQAASYLNEYFRPHILWIDQSNLYIIHISNTRFHGQDFCTEHI